MLYYFQVYSKVISYTYPCLIFQIPFPFRLLQSIKQSSLSCTVGSCWLSVSNVAACTCRSQTPNLSLPLTFPCSFSVLFPPSHPCTSFGTAVSLVNSFTKESSTKFPSVIEFKCAISLQWPNSDFFNQTNKQKIAMLWNIVNNFPMKLFFILCSYMNSQQFSPVIILCCFWPHPAACRILVPYLLHWKCRFLTTGPSEKSLPSIFFIMWHILLYSS